MPLYAVGSRVLKGTSEKARDYLTFLCSVKPNRRTGSQGNRDATEWFARIVDDLGYEVDASPFSCLDYVAGESSLISGNSTFEIYIGPYSMPCDTKAELVTVTTAAELENCTCDGKILLMKNDICGEQLMPKNFVFYNPDHHKRIYSLLEDKCPAGIITATAKLPDLVGALYPFPLIVDGDFDIPNVFCTDAVGETISEKTEETFSLKIDAERIPTTASNVIARLNSDRRKKIVITAHIDAYENSPGASDNASGTVVLLLLAEMLKIYGGDSAIEIVAINGEDHYSVAGEMDYLKRYGNALEKVSLSINIDDVGCRVGRCAYSFYDCAPEIVQKTNNVFGRFTGMVKGEPWFNGDHMMFVQKGIPSIALTSENLTELMATITHTSRDTPHIVDERKLVEVAGALKQLICEL
jgi:aminopeptidase YwaD